MPEALDDITVIEFGGYAAGPAIGKYLANFGARVIHVESDERPDGFRLQYPPFKDGKVGLNRGGCFAFFNDSKLGVTVDLKTADGVATAQQLIDNADVLIENMRPGVIDRLGFGWETLHARNPRLVMLSTSNMGSTGPQRSHPGFGSQLSSLSGFTELIGAPDGPPSLLYGPYIDLIAVAYGGAAILAALDHRRRSGEGVFIDLSQYEAGVQFISPAILDYTANGVVARRHGNHDPVAVPHGSYRCSDDRWCAISCWDEDEWHRFCRAANCPWDRDERFADAGARRIHEAELDALIAEWVRTQESTALMHHLQANGVHAAVVNSVKDLFSDPQLAARGVWQEMRHPEIGPHHYRMVSYQLSETPGRVRGPAPCLGENNGILSEDLLAVEGRRRR